jgi:alpha-L-rhamnosidase
MVHKHISSVFQFACCVLLFSLGCQSELEINPAQDLIIGEGFKNPIGFYKNTPAFSWKLPVSENAKSQTAYRIVAARDSNLLPNGADLWDSKKVNSDQSVWISYKGTQLESRQKVYWKVMFWDQNDRPSKWSELAYFELGLLENSDWNASWIYLQPEEQVDESSIYSPQYLRKTFVKSGEIKQARLYITSRGVFEAQINGERVGQDVMAPGWTPYKKRFETLTYDVTPYLNEGKNAIGVTVGQGWYWGRINYFDKKWSEAPYPSVICQLEIIYENGEKQIINSDSSWKGTTQGPIRFSGIYDGETYDANLEMPGWSTYEFNDEAWKNVESENIDPEINLLPKRHASVTDKEELSVIEITEPESGKIIFDLGQNMVGVAEVNIPAKKHQKVIIRFAEMLQQDGNLYTANYRTAKSTDYYIPNQDGKIQWRPKFTFHGFRYVELSGFDTDMIPEKSWIKGIVQYSDFEQTGYFSSSHEKLNLLQSNINWGLKGNFLDIPTDCPQRDERMGWAGDAQVFAPTSIFNRDVYPFWASWLQSMREEQFASGRIPIVIPSNRSYESSAGWSDAATVIPWELYMKTGDTTVLEENYQMMLGLVNYYQLVASSNSKKLMPLGDWLQPFSKNTEDSNKGETSIELIETAYFAHSTDLTYKAAEVLGNQADMGKLSALRDSLRKVFADQFFDEGGKLTTEFETQAGYLMALGFDLVSDEMAQKMVPNLVRKINEADNHLRTGFLGTPLLAPVLDKYGQTDLMYDILFKETYPSWFYSINQGATTMWERWNSYSHTDGFGEVSMNSFNHYAYGAIGQWLYEGIAGISPLEPGYKKILIAPKPGEQLEHASAEYNSVYGIIASNWKKTDNKLQLDVTIPPNTTATIVLPIDAKMNLLMNGKPFKHSDDLKLIKRNSNNVVIHTNPGSYTFKTEVKNND